MKLLSLPLEQITFTYCDYDHSLKESLQRMGQGFPILVIHKDDHYECIDGHKRLSAIQDLCIEYPKIRGKQVKAIMKNARSASGTTKNHH